MRNYTKLRSIGESALSGPQKDISAFSFQHEHLCRIMEQKISLMTRYLSVTKAMKETLVSKNEIKLGDLLSKRQDCINRIQKIDFSVQKAINHGKEELSLVPNGIKAVLDGYRQSIKSLIEQITPVDAEIMVLVREVSHDIKAELLKISNARQAAKGYGSKKMNIPVYMDAKR